MDQMYSICPTDESKARRFISWNAIKFTQNGRVILRERKAKAWGIGSGEEAALRPTPYSYSLPNL